MYGSSVAKRNSLYDPVVLDTSMTAWEFICEACDNPETYASKKLMPLWHGYAFSNDDPDTTPTSTEVLVVDFDGGKPFTEVWRMLSCYEFLIHASPSNIDGCKFRVVLPLEAPIARRSMAYRKNKSMLLDLFSGCDPTTFDWKRYFYIPGIVEDKTKYFVLRNYGKVFSVVDDLIGWTKAADCPEPSDDVQEAHAPVIADRSSDTTHTMSAGLSLVASVEGDCRTTEQLLDEVEKMLNDLGEGVNDRGGGKDVHYILLKCAQLCRRAGLSDHDGNDLVFDLVSQYVHASKETSIAREIERIFFSSKSD